MCAGMGGEDVGKAITDLFSKRGETRRIKRTDSLGAAAYTAAGLGPDFDAAIEDVLFASASEINMLTAYGLMIRRGIWPSHTWEKLRRQMVRVPIPSI
jgi:hypothetical protein